MDKSKVKEEVKFYILFPGDTEESCDREMNQIGLVHYRKKYLDKTKTTFHRQEIFTKLEGYRRLERAIMKDRVDILEKTRIFNSKGKQFSIEEMFDRINKADIVNET